jgi:type I restriction enzyme S subunit
MSGSDAEADLPPGWCWATFSTVAKIAANLVPPQDWPDLPHIAPDNIARNTGQLLPYRTVREDKVISANHLFSPGQLLYSKIRPYLNKCVRVDFAGLCSADMYPLDSYIDTSYLHNYILSRRFVSSVTEAAGSRTVLPKTNQQQMAQVPVPVAPLAEQRRIVEAVDSYFTRLDDAVATLERVERNLKRYRASVLKSAVEGRLVPTEAELARQEGRAYEPASVLLDRILAERRRRWSESGKKGKYQEPAPPDTTNLPDLPEGWCWTNMDALIVYGPQNGIYVPKSRYGHGAPILRIDDYQSDWSRSSSDLQMIDISEAEVKSYGLMLNDLVINRVNSPSHLGKTLCVDTKNLPAVFESNMMRMALGEGANARYVHLYLSSADGKARLIENAKWAVNQASINQGDVACTAVPLPPAAEQTRLLDETSRLLSAAYAGTETVERNAHRCLRLRQAILKWAFEGKLAEQDLDDEPALMLLERIRAGRVAATLDAFQGSSRRAKKQPRA